MIDDTTTLTHHIQRHMLDVLRRQEFARFRDLRPDGVDSNAFSYHLTQLLKQGIIDKRQAGYTLSTKGLAYIDRVSTSDIRPRRQPKIMTMTVVQDESGNILVRRKQTQPMIHQVTLPTGMLHMEDASIAEAARREVREKMNLMLTGEMVHVGDCYMAIRHDGQVMMNSLLHVFVASVPSSDIPLHDGIFWRSPDDLADAAPATRRVMARLQQRSDSHERFFEEYTEEL